MNLQQLRIITEAARRNCNLTEVADALHTSQSGVSKHIKDLENELGVELFIRKGKRLLGFTPPGQELVTIAERIVLDTKNIRKLGEQFSNRNEGQLTVATTHTQARYALPKVVRAFKAEYPKVNLVLNEAGPAEIVAMLRTGQADIGVATEALAETSDLVTFPYYAWHHGVVVPAGQPLEGLQPLTLAALADFPIITYQHGFTGRRRIDVAFASAELEPEIVMSALDADVIKAYVELDLGVGIIASMAFDEERDPRLRLLDARHLFARNISRIAVRQGTYLRNYAFRFMALCTPDLSEAKVKAAIDGGRCGD